jgi:hypothetical protein
VASAISTVKTAVFVLVFLPPFYYVGRILTALYAINRGIIGKIYGFDLFGASLACFVTPVLFHFIDLPYLIVVCMVAMTVITSWTIGRQKIKLVGAFVVLILAMLPLLVFLEGRYDMRQTVASKRDVVDELAHRWNEYSRVSLLRIRRGGDESKPTYKIIHDNAESNVYVIPYKPGDEAAVAKDSESRAPFVLGRPTDDILVMFAGCGRDMIKLDELGGGKKRMIGVEINPLVMDFALQAPELKHYRLREFFAKPNVKMMLVEGRRFMDNDHTKYNIIYAGSDAATSQYKTGHSRKYLDTKEAIEVYFDHLQPDGTLIFNCQPSVHLVESMKAVYADRALGDIRQHLVLLSNSLDNCDDLIYSNSALTSDDSAKLTELFGRQVQYAPGYERNRARAAALVEGPVLPQIDLVTDDRPYLHKLDFANFHLLPAKRQLSDVGYYRSWIKIETMLLVGLVLIGILVYLYVRRAPMPPPSMMIYLLFTGFCYMLVEITYIGKLELFLENPLYSMALLLTIFLMANAIGSMAYNKIGRRLPMNVMPLVAGGLVLGMTYLMQMAIDRRLGWSLPVKTLITVVLFGPVGVCLGLFYPHVVTWLTGRELVKTIPITYGVSTLSSVAGATYAMIMIINFGYTDIIYQAVVGYAALAIVMVVHKFAVAR